MAKREGQGMYKESPPTDDEHSDGGGGGEEGLTCWFTPRGRGRWRFARVERKQQSSYRFRMPSLATRSQSAALGRPGDSASSYCCCCCGPRWRRGDEGGDAGATRDKPKSLLRFTDGKRVSAGLSPLPVRTMSKTERETQRHASVPIWQRRASMSPIKALNLRLQTS